MKKMLAVHLEDGKVTIRERLLPQNRDGFALIRLLCAGICNTDLELLKGYYNFRGTPGHEFVGEVVESGKESLIGRRVVGEINIACGRCDWCSRGMERHCPKRDVLGILRWPGVFSEYFILPERNLHTVPEKVSNQEAVFTEPLAAACEIRDQVKIPRGSAVAVLGDGKLGLLIAQVLQYYGANVYQYGRHREKLRISSLAGVHTTVSTRLPASAYDWVVEATGSPDGLQLAARMVRPRGTIVMKSTTHGPAEIDAAALVVNEVTLVGSRCGRFRPALRLLHSGKIPVSRMITESVRLEEAPRAFELAARPGTMKVLLRAGSR